MKSFLRVHGMASALIAWCTLSAICLRYPQFPYDALLWLWVIQGYSFNPTKFAHGRILYHGNRPDSLFFPLHFLLFLMKKGISTRHFLCRNLWPCQIFFFSKIISESNLKSKTALNIALIGKFQLLVYSTLFLFPCDVNSTLFF